MIQRQLACLAAAFGLAAPMSGCEESAGGAAVPQAERAAPVAAADSGADEPTATNSIASAATAADSAPGESTSPAIAPAAAKPKKPRPARSRQLPTFGDDAPPRERAVPARQGLVQKAGQPQQINFDTIKFDMQKGDPFDRKLITPQIEALAGQKVEIRGYILPSFQQQGIKQFVLVRDNMECCFGPGAALYDCIIVDMTPPATATYTVRPVTVRGTFNINILPGPDGETLAIYHLDGEAVQ